MSAGGLGRSALDLVARLSVGYMFVSGAVRKTSDSAWFESRMRAYGIPLPHQSALLVAWVELIGGALLMLGLATRLVSALLAGVIAVALVTAIAPPLRQQHPGAAEFFSYFFYASEWPLLLVLVALALHGAGRWSADRWLAKALAGNAGPATR
ncbi:MAG: DoxX family protein [Segniliparus sp.]|uniref:DoxX family protein n=1 Tax=Segniliparus sp. TaxID=2804064 RepID=UPI003F399E4D